MAEIDNGEYELKDEELVDFEGSDYGFGSDEELEIDDEVVQPNLANVEGNTVWDSGEGKDKNNEAPHVTGVSGPRQPTGEDVTFLSDGEKERREGAESGEIEDEKDEKEDGVVQPLSSFMVAINNHSFEKRVGETRRKHRKADLEDGELDDAAMPEGSDHEAEGNADDDDEDESVGRERKRRKDRFAAERHMENLDRKERESTSLVATGRQHRSRGSTERPLERTGGFNKNGNPGVRGVMQMSGFSRAANMAPGIMGPGRPLVPLDLATLPLRPMGRGFMGPFTGLQMANRSNIHLQEAMAVQEHMLRSHQLMQLAHASAAGRPMAGQMGGPSMRPMVGIEFGGQLPQRIMHFHSPGPDLTTQINLVGPVDPFSRSPRAGYGGRGPGGMFGQVGGRMGSSPGSGVGRQNSWAAGTVQGGELLAVGGGRGQGRGQVGAPVWGDPHVVMAQGAATQAGLGQSLGAAQNVNIGQARGADMMGIGHGKARQGLQNLGNGNQGQRISKRMEAAGRVESDGTWRIDPERGTRNGAPQKKEKDLRTLSSNTAGSGNKRERVGGHEKDTPVSSNPSKSVLTPQGQGVNNGSATASNLIQLGGPVQKSRVLTVSGLPENTSMSVVVEAFEKQGKVTDFKKEERGDAFTITFASVSEAISAQRHLHRSILAGRQITVEYAVLESDS